ncbi:hypothetical protein ACSRUE_15010 [Sorangium sp. KYC3313]|uniref:hypothetical protein n=1 Tax=Sorangium sp. KYC3313 TaxID=3449740 RepID=UPI003F886DB3
MKPIDAFQAYLMSCMRNEECIAEGLRRLGINPADVDVAKEMVARAGALYGGEGTAGECRADSYLQLLGAPQRVVPAPAKDAFFYATRMLYSLPAWPGLQLELRMGVDQTMCGIRFVRAGEKQRRLRLEEVIPWRVVEDDIRASCSEAIVVDGLGTWTDYCCTLLEPGSPEYFWAFDFGLLQEVCPWKDLNIEKRPLTDQD